MPDDPDRSHDTDPLADTQTSDDSSVASSSSSVSAKRRQVGAGDVLGRYELIEEIGEGGMATVYRAKDRELRREVAIKVLFPHLARREDVVRRFHREARAAAGLEHANILRVYDVGGGEGADGAVDPPYIVMELVRGHSLLAEIERHGPMLAEVAACIGALLADALAVAHAAGIIHRDIKPANVMIAPGGRILLADFGVARLETEDSLVTKTGSVLGTPAYMSPEQASGDTATAKSDLYSLGATVYQLATGSLPYTGSPAKVLSQIASGSLVPAVRRRAAVGPDLSRAIDRLMAVDVAARPANAADVAAELRAIASTGGLGDPNDELAAYFADPDAFVKHKLPTVVSSLVTAAERAVADEKLPRAIALADRASALAPDDPAVTQLIETVTEGGKSSRRKRLLALGGALVLVGGGVTFGAMQLVGGDGDVGHDAAFVAVIDDASVPADAAIAADAGEVVAAMPDAAAAPMIVDAGAIAVRVRADAGVPRVRDAAIAMARIDASVAVPDAAIAIAPPPLDAATPAVGYVIVKNDTWCEVTIDGLGRGRANQKAIELAAGKHTVVCAQPGTGNTWTQAVLVPPGKTVTVEGTMLATIEVRLDVDARLNGVAYASGASVRLKAGRYELRIGGRKVFLDLRSACTVRATPEPGCY